MNYRFFHGIMHSIKHMKYGVKAFLTYLIIILVPIYIFISFVQIKYINALQNDSLNVLESRVNTLSDIADDVFLQMSRINESILVDNTIMDRYSVNKPDAYFQLQKRLKTYLCSTLFVSEIYLAYEDNDYLFGSCSSYTKERFIKMNGLTDYSVETLNDFFLRAGPMCLLRTNRSNDTVLFVFKNRSVTRKNRFILFQVKQDKLLQYMINTLAPDTGYVEIANESEILFSADSSNVGSSLPEICSEYKEGIQSVDFNGETWYLVQKKSNVAGLYCRIVLQGMSIYGNRITLLQSWIALVSAVLLMTCAAVWIISRLSIRPVAMLSSKVQSIDTEYYPSNDEVEHICLSIDRLSNNIDMLNEYLSFRLFRGSIQSIEEANQLQRIMNAPFYAHSYQVCIISFGKELSMQAARKTILGALKRNKASCLLRKMDSLWAVAFFLYSSDDDDEIIEAFSDFFFSEYPNGRLSFGMPYERFSDIPCSYMEAWIAAHEQCKNLCYFMLDSQDEYDRTEFEQALEADSPCCVNDLLSILLQRLKEGTYSLERGAYAMLCICVSLEKYDRVRKEGIELPDVYMLMACTSIEQLISMLEPLLETLRSNVQKHEAFLTGMPMVEQMKEYIQQHYLETTFSLKQMAFDFRLVPSEMSRFFKENSGIGMNDFLTGLKMERAKVLLLETQLSVNEIGLELGYFGQNSFIRRFKTIYGITPGEFRHTSQ